MTRERMDDNGTEFGLWLRGQLPGQQIDVSSIGSRMTQQSVGYDAQNLDYVWFAYKEGSLMMLEEKRYGAQQHWNQSETHSILDQALEYACNDMGLLFRRNRRDRPKQLIYYGYHVITFERTNPEDGLTWIDGRTVTVNRLLAFLRFDLPREFYNRRPEQILVLDEAV